MAIGMGLDGMTTTHGGIVKATTDLSFGMGRPFLRVGDGFFCPKCKVWSTLLDVYPHVVVDGRAVVPLNAKFSCGAELMGVNNHTVMEYGSGSGSSIVKKEYCIQYQLLDEETGEPLRNYPYKKIIDGEEITGVTDSNGYTQKINKQQKFLTKLFADSVGGE